MKKIFIISVVFAVFFIVSCGDDKKVENDDENVNDADELTDDEGITPICKTPGDGPYELKFTDITEELGLKGMDVLGSQITIADIDGDRWSDIYVTLSSKLREDPSAPKGLYRLLKNKKGNA
ncbi:MAG TPA: hypothetical protein PKM18_10515, partial [bacterium]|nr:hypothetical protein [bacterium]